MIASSSLFDRRGDSVLEPASGWLVALLSGPAATSLCVIAVAILGLAMLTGRIAPRRGMQVVMGCFVLLGASTMAGQLRDLASGGVAQAPVPLIIENDVPPPLPPADYDPYAGASLRRRDGE